MSPYSGFPLPPKDITHFMFISFQEERFRLDLDSASRGERTKSSISNCVEEEAYELGKRKRD